MQETGAQGWGPRGDYEPQRPLDEASAEAIAAAALAVNMGNPAAALVDLLRMYLSTVSQGGPSASTY